LEKLPPTKAEQQVRSLFQCVLMLVSMIPAYTAGLVLLGIGIKHGLLWGLAGWAAGMFAGFFVGLRLALRFGPRITNRLFRAFKGR